MLLITLYSHDANTPPQNGSQLGVAELVNGAVVVDRCVDQSGQWIAGMLSRRGLKIHAEAPRPVPNQVVGRRLETAATTFADVNGFGMRTLFGTPFACHSCSYAVT